MYFLKILYDLISTRPKSVILTTMLHQLKFSLLYQAFRKFFIQCSCYFCSCVLLNRSLHCKPRPIRRWRQKDHKFKASPGKASSKTLSQKQAKNFKWDWTGHSSSGRVFFQHAHGLGFNPQNLKRKKLQTLIVLGSSPCLRVP